MRRVMVRYRVKPDRVDENESLVRAVYEELHRANPPGFRYATFKLDDGVTFTHIAMQTTDGPNPLSELEAFEQFQREIGDRCDVLPVVTDLTGIGSFGF